MELHNKALKYLQRHTRRCVACNELQFARLLGKTTTKYDAQESKKKTIEFPEIQLEEVVYTVKHTKNGIYYTRYLKMIDTIAHVERDKLNKQGPYRFIVCKRLLI